MNNSGLITKKRAVDILMLRQDVAQHIRKIIHAIMERICVDCG